MTHPTEHAVAYLMVVSAPWKHYRCTMVAMGQSMGYTMIHTIGKNHAGPRQTLVVLVRWDTPSRVPHGVCHMAQPTGGTFFVELSMGCTMG